MLADQPAKSSPVNRPLCLFSVVSINSLFLQKSSISCAIKPWLHIKRACLICSSRPLYLFSASLITFKYVLAIFLLVKKSPIEGTSPLGR